ncbi:DUF5776 domain-containing protein, partial [Apilactobacillus sp. TMW 2.2459]|uniref:DUF5776 domain-containing protein n=1 Tax=Apilactobacillus xinyiensis TaxID=2841032 RepID=UPI00200DE590
NAASQAKQDYDNVSSPSYHNGSNAVADGVYNNAYSNVSSAAARAQSDFVNGGFKSDSSSISQAVSGYSPIEAQTYSEARNAMSAALSDIDKGSGSNGNYGSAKRYNSMYSSVYSNLNSAYGDGKLDGAIGLDITHASYASDSLKNSVYNHVYGSESDAVSKAISSANNDFNNDKYGSLFGSYAYSSDTYVNDAYNKVYSSLSFDVRKAQLDFKNSNFDNSQSSNSPYDVFYGALSKAANDFINKGSYNNSYSSIVKSIYDEQYNLLKLAASQGRSDFYNNNGDNSSSYSYDWSLEKAYKDAYNDYAGVISPTNNNINDNNSNSVNDALNDFRNMTNREHTSDDYNKDYVNIENGFNDGINNKKAKSTTSSYLSGYEMGKNGMLGINHAIAVENSDESVGDLGNKSEDFILGFNGFNDGFKAAIDKHSRKHADKGPVYNFAYDKGYEFGLTKISDANKGSANETVKYLKHPVYVYNTELIHAYSKKELSESGIVKKYNKKHLGNLNELKIVKIVNNNDGKSVYELSDGSFIEKSNLKDLYYKNVANGNEYKVIAKGGIHVHSSSNLTTNNRIAFWKKGHKFTVKKVVDVNGRTRFYIGDSQYVTGNKNFVKIDM